jgi:peptide chain release factor
MLGCLTFYPVSKRKAEELQSRMAAAGCDEKDLEESFLPRCGVAIHHRPSGVRVRCCRERSQRLNRFLARRLLVEELEARKRNLTRHEVTAERLRQRKHRQPKIGVQERLNRIYGSRSEEVQEK